MALNKGYLSVRANKTSDEYYTPAYAVTPLIKYIKKFNEQAIIWCPFDTKESHYVKEFEKAGFKVISSHIDEGKNFFFYEPEEKYDIIISNPPFSIKDDIIKRLYELKKPYAMLLPVPTLQGKKRFNYIKECQALIFDGRINYWNGVTNQVQKGTCFGSFYLCKDFLEEKLIFEELEIKE